MQSSGVVVPGLQSTGSIVVTHRLSCSSAYGIFPDSIKPVSCIGRRILYYWATSSVQFSHSVVSDSLWHHEPQHARPPCPSPTPGVHPKPCSSSWWCHLTISSLSSPSPPDLNLSQHQGLFKWVSSSHEVAKVLEFQFQHQSFQWTHRTNLL